ncbi:MAG TPA: hypothetical protein VGE65_00445 [Sphingobium sp.]
MSILALMALGAGAVAIPDRAGSGEQWLGPGDIPKSAFESGKDGAFFFKAVVNPAGKVELCTIEGSTVPAAEDRDAFCKRIKQRFAYRPVAGDSSYYVLEENYAFILPADWHRNALAIPPHFVVEVKKLPAGAGKTAYVAVNVAVDEQGALRDCGVPANAVNATLSRLACGQLPSIWSPMPEKNAAGKPVAYVRQMHVEFREPGAPAG